MFESRYNPSLQNRTAVLFGANQDADSVDKEALAVKTVAVLKETLANKLAPKQQPDRRDAERR